MFSRLCFHYGLLAALSTIAQGMIMVKSVDGSFVPWPLLPRAPGDGSVPVYLKNNADLSYLATVLMGVPQQQVPMAPSLSQALVAVASPASGVDNSSYYNPKLSSTFTPSSDVASIQTLSGGAITGHLAGETCKLQSSATTLSFTYNASIVLTDSTVRDDLYPVGANGVLGYGVNNPPSLPQNASLVTTFVPSNFTAAICGIELNHKDDPVPDGILTMGAVDPTAFTGPFTDVIVPSDSPVSWSIPFDKLSYSAGGNSYDLPGLVASVDIIHTGIKIRTHDAQRMYSCIPGAHPVSDTIWSIPCNSTFAITLTFAGKAFAISERDTIRKYANGSCHGAVTGGANNMAQVGAPFLRNVYTQFGINKTSSHSAVAFVGFAAKKLRQR